MKKVFLIFSLATSSMNAMQHIPPFLDHHDEWIEKTLNAMTLREKIGQLFIVAAASNFNQPNEILASSMLASPYRMDEEYISSLITHYHIGGIVFLYKSDPATQMALTKKFQSQSKIPLLIAQDCEWGLAMRLDFNPSAVVRYPRNMTLGAITHENSIYDIGYEIGRQCAAIGVHMNLAPVVDVNNNADNPVIGDRSFGDNPKHVAHLGTLFARGLQDAGILACAKHFPGHGDTSVDSHYALPLIEHTRKRLEEIELLPFKKLIDEGVSAIMMAHLAIPAFDETPNLPSSLSYKVVTDELKNNLNFKGLIITDGLGMGAITNHYQPGELELAAFLAGNDILLCPLDVPRAVKNIEQAIITGLISENELNKRVTKILQAKAWARNKLIDENSAREFLVRQEAQILQKTAYQAAMTLVKNNGSNFGPSLIQNSYCLPIGTLPENVFMSFLAKHSPATDPYSATFSDQELELCLERSKYYASVIISISTMNKFSQKNFGVSKNVPQLLTSLKAAGKQVIIIIFGTPYSVHLFDSADTIIVAYEDAIPAQEAATEVLFGMLEPKGKLAVNV